MIAIPSFMFVAGFFLWWMMVKKLPKSVSDSRLLSAILLVFSMSIMQPFSSWSPGFFVRGLTGDFSFFSYMLVIDAMAFRFGKIHFFSSEEKRLLLVLIALTGIVFYPLSLGMGLYDPYASGFGSYWLVFSLFAIGVYCLSKHWYAGGITLGLAMLAWSCSAYESTNLWDYVFDPWVWLYALGACIVWLTRLGLQRLQHKSTLMSQ